MNPRLLCAWLLCLAVLQPGAARGADEAPQVPVVRPVVREVVDYEDFTGRTDARIRVDLRARVTGYLLKTTFQEGGTVKQGDVLFEIDPRPYQADLDRADAALNLAEARLKLAQATLKRMKALLATKAVGREEWDRAAAEVVEAEAAVRAARATREAARLNLDFTRVVAPISGHIGRQLVDPGNLVKADDTLLASIVTRDPLYVYFDIDERTLLHLRRAVPAGGAAAKILVAIGLAGEEGFPHRAAVDFVNNSVDADTGTIRLRAVLPNPRGLIDPGMFVRVRLAIGEPYKAVLVPAEAVLSDQGARFLYVVNDKDVIERRPVTVGAEHDGLRVIAQGLRQGERVAVGRLQQLRPGMTVRPENPDKPEPKPAPPPADSPPPEVRPARVQHGPTVLVEAVYPGANAQVVADTIPAPIEQQVNGVEKLLSLRSRCTNDGKYTLAVTFQRGADASMSQVLVQNRVALALPVLPDVVKSAGVIVTKAAPGVQVIVTLLSPEGRYDTLYLSNYASIQIKDELGRLPSVGRVTLVGQGDYAMRIWLDPDKLAARKLTAAEVVKSIEGQNLKAAPARGGRAAAAKGRPVEITVDTLGRLADPEELADFILKADGEGRVVRLKDVATVELGAGRYDGQASLDGRPCVALVLHPAWDAGPRKLGAAVREKLAELRSRLPEGLDLAIAVDFSANEWLLLEPELPAGVSAERTHRTLDRCAALLREVPGVQKGLTLTDNPFDLFGGGPCVVVGLAPAQKGKADMAEVARAVRTRLDEIKNMTLRVRYLSRAGDVPHFSYPIRLAVYGPEPAPVRDFARKLADRLRRDKGLTDVWADPASTPRPMRSVEIDRTKAAMLGVSVKDIFATLQVYGGGALVNDFRRFGRFWRTEVQVAPGSGDWAKDLRQLKVRNMRGDMVPLGALVSVRDTEGPLAVDFFDLWPVVPITANLAAGASADEVRARCATLAEQVRKELGLSPDYRVKLLQ
jgi:RND family efflux transporter MFP subunit